MRIALAAALLCFCMTGISQARKPGPRQVRWLAEASRTAFHPEARQIASAWYSATAKQLQTGKGTLVYTWANNRKTLLVDDSANNTQLAVTRRGSQLNIAKSVIFPGPQRQMTYCYDERTQQSALGGSVAAGTGCTYVQERTYPGGPVGFAGGMPQNYAGVRGLGRSLIRPSP
jgi:hypothetical protein